MATHPTDVANAAARGLFKVTGTWQALVDPVVSGSWSMPELVNVNALVSFTPRIPIGSVMHLEDGTNTSMALPVRYARIWAGKLCNINTTDTADVYLQANTAKLDLLDSLGLAQLIYDVQFSKVTFGGKPKTYQTTPDGAPAPSIQVTGDQSISPFAFVAPTSPADVVCLTSPTLVRLPWAKQPGPAAPYQKKPGRLEVVEDAG